MARASHKLTLARVLRLHPACSSALSAAHRCPGQRHAATHPAGAAPHTHAYRCCCRRAVRRLPCCCPPHVLRARGCWCRPAHRQDAALWRDPAVFGSGPHHCCRSGVWQACVLVAARPARRGAARRNTAPHAPPDVAMRGVADSARAASYRAMAHRRRCCLRCPPPQAETAKRALTAGVATSKSDHLAVVAAYNTWRATMEKDGRQAAHELCARSYVSDQAMEAVDAARKQYAEILADLGFVPPGYANCASMSRGGGSASAREGWEVDAYSAHARTVKAAICSGEARRTLLVLQPAELLCSPLARAPPPPRLLPPVAARGHACSQVSKGARRRSGGGRRGTQAQIFRPRPGCAHASPGCPAAWARRLLVCLPHVAVAAALGCHSHAQAASSCTLAASTLHAAALRAGGSCTARWWRPQRPSCARAAWCRSTQSCCLAVRDDWRATGGVRCMPSTTPAGV